MKEDPSIHGGARACAPLAAQPAETVRAIHAGTLIAVPARRRERDGDRPRLEDRRGPRGFVDVPGAEVIDLRTATVMPASSTCTSICAGSTTPCRRGPGGNVRDYEDEAFTAMLNARKTLLAGFTTVRDLGSDPRLILACATPSTRACSPARPSSPPATASAAPAGTRPAQRPQPRPVAVENDTVINTCNGADDCRRAVRDQIGLGADWIKITATGGVLSNVAGRPRQADDGR